MTPPRTVLDPARIDIFLEYRRESRKVYPVANHYKVARSTVSLIVKEFLKAGFSDRPRLDLPLRLLKEAQGSHQLELSGELKKKPSISIAEPGGNPRGGLSELEAIGGDPVQALRARRTIDLDSRLRWHLKGTDVETTLEEVGNAITRYNEQCFGFWQMIKEDLEKPPGYKTLLPGAKLADDAKGHLYPTLIDAVSRKFCSLPTRKESLDPDWPLLTPQKGSNGELGLVNSPMAWVSPEDNKLPDHVLTTVRAHAEVYLSQGNTLVATHGDLRYVLSYAQRLLGEVTDEQVQQGVCPECPYPESVDRSTIPAAKGRERGRRAT